jgi:hypothetical protein
LSTLKIGAVYRLLRTFAIDWGLVEMFASSSLGLVNDSLAYASSNLL